MKWQAVSAIFAVVCIVTAEGSDGVKHAPSQQVARKQLIAEAHTEAREVEAAWSEFEHANAMQQTLTGRLAKLAETQRKAGNVTAALRTEAGLAKLQGVQGELDGRVGHLHNQLSRAKVYIPDNLLQKRKFGKRPTFFLQTSNRENPEDALAKEMTHDLTMNFNKIAPFGKEDTAKELQDHAAKTQDTLVDAVENAEVAEIKRAVFRALTRLRAATIKEFDTIARLETQAIDAYNDAHHYRAENPLAHLHEDEAPVETDKLKSFH